MKKILILFIFASSIHLIIGMERKNSRMIIVNSTTVPIELIVGWAYERQENVHAVTLGPLSSHELERNNAKYFMLKGTDKKDMPWRFSAQSWWFVAFRGPTNTITTTNMEHHRLGSENALCTLIEKKASKKTAAKL